MGWCRCMKRLKPGLGQVLADETDTVLHSDGSVTRAGRIVDVDREGLPTDDVIAIPLPRPGSQPAYFAVIAASHVARPQPEQRQVAALLAHLAAGSLPLEKASKS
jgi:hypothetical protein